jgi:hypothetical protein
MSGEGCLVVNRNKDWTSHSKVMIRTGNRALLNALLQKASEMSSNGFGKTIYHFGARGNELHIFSRLGTGIDVLSYLLEGQDCHRLRTEAVIETLN